MSCQTVGILGKLPQYHRPEILAMTKTQPEKDMTKHSMRPVLLTSEAEPGLLIAYDPDAHYPYWACWEADRVPGNQGPQIPVGQGNTPQEAIDCLYALMAQWYLYHDGQPSLAAPTRDNAA